MRRVWRGVVLVAAGVAVTLVAAGVLGQEATASEGWIELPGDGDATARAFVRVKNPTMYDIYLVSAESDVCRQVEFRRTVDGEAQPVPEITVPAYGSVSLGADGIYLELVDLKRSLEPDETIPLTLTTDSSVKLRVEALVRKE